MATPDQVRRLADAGHEIGCHTYSHLDCGQAAACDAVEDVARNAETLAAWGVGRPTTFAYPFGDVAPATKRAMAPRFALMRALHGRNSGLCQPTYVLDIPGGHGKSPIGPDYLHRVEGRIDEFEIEDFNGGRRIYPPR